jgi:hypothetical protein
LRTLIPNRLVLITGRVILLSSRGRDRMVVGFSTTYEISAYHHSVTLWVLIQLGQGVFDTTVCDKVCQWLAAGRWFSPGIPVSSTIKTDRHDKTEIVLTVVLNTITLTPNRPHYRDTENWLCHIINTIEVLIASLHGVIIGTNRPHYRGTYI